MRTGLSADCRPPDYFAEDLRNADKLFLGPGDEGRLTSATAGQRSDQPIPGQARQHARWQDRNIAWFRRSLHPQAGAGFIMGGRLVE